jgi:WD40 repeat protein
MQGKSTIISRSNSACRLQVVKLGHYLSLPIILCTAAVSLVGCTTLSSFFQGKAQIQPIELTLQPPVSSVEGIDSNLALSPDGIFLVANGITEPLTLRRKTDGQKLLVFSEGSKVPAVKIPGVVASAFSPDSQTLAGATHKHQILLWTTQKGEIRQRFSGHSTWVDIIKFSPNGQLLASGSMDKTIKIWDVKTGQLQRTLQLTQSVAQISFSEDATIINSTDINGSVQQWHVRTGEAIQPFAHLQNKSAVKGEEVETSLSADGMLVARAETDKTIKIWNLKTGQEVSTLSGHYDIAHTIKFSPSGHLIATAARSGKRELTTWGSFHHLRIWDVKTGELIAQSDGIQYIMSLVFTPDSKTLITAGDAGKIRLWDLAKSAPSP